MLNSICLRMLLLDFDILKLINVKGCVMSESMTRRVGRLISGSLNAVIDAAENISPEIVMQESIREVDQAISEVRHELGKMIVQEKMTQERITSEETKHQELLAQITIALTEGREDLAEAAISKQMDIEAQLPVLKSTLAEAQAQVKEMEGFIAALQAKKREMQDELKRFSEHNKKQASSSNTVDQVSQAQEAFNRVMGSDTTPATQTDSAKLAELEALARKNRIQERLDAMKAAQE